MYVNNRMASLIYKLALIAVCITGLVMNSGLLSGTFAPYRLLYYTITSNLFCLVFYIISAVITGRSISSTGKAGLVKFAPHFKGAVVMAMLLTTIIFFFDGAHFNGSAYSVVSAAISHFIVPVMVLVDWLLFDRKGNFSPVDPLVWLAVPFLYYAVILFMAEPHMIYVEYYGGVHYPYNFINPEIQGSNWMVVLVNVFLLTLIYTAAGYVLFGADRIMGNHAKKKALAAEGVPPVAPGAGNADALNTQDDLAHEGEAAASHAAPAATAQPAAQAAPAQAASPAAPVPPAAAPAAPAPPVSPPAQPKPVQAPAPVQPPPAAPVRPIPPMPPLPPSAVSPQAPADTNTGAGPTPGASS